MEDKNRVYGIVGTVIFHGLILLWLIFTYMTFNRPQELGGILVNFGYVDEGSGLFEPNINPSGDVLVEEPTTAAVEIPKPQPEKQVLAQDIEQSVSVADAKKKEEERKRKQDEERRKAENERKRREEQANADAINRMAAGAFSTNSQQSSQGSSTSGNNNQGSPFGNSNTGSNQGIGGTGGGTSFSLEGRMAEGLPRPATSISEEGRIVVNITVNSAGNVIFAEIGAGTNIGNTTMRRASIEAAKKSKFNAIQKSNNQMGSITYRYSLR